MIDLIDHKAERSVESPLGSADEPKTVHFRPDGPQGVKIGLRIEGVDDYQRLDEAFGNLSPEERSTASGIRKAAKEAGIPETES